MAVSAPDFFPIIFGPKWNNAILPFQILAVYGMIRCLWIDPFGALGDFKSSFWLSLVTFILSFFGILIGLQFGIVGVAMAILIIVGGAHILALYIASNSLSRFLAGLKNATPYLLTSLGTALIAFFIRCIFLGVIGDVKAVLFASSMLTIFGIYVFVFRNKLREIFILIRNKT